MMLEQLATIGTFVFVTLRGGCGSPVVPVDDGRPPFTA